MDFYTKAEQFGIDLTHEPFLLGLLKQSLETPLPPHWIKEEVNDSRPTTQTRQETLWSYFDKSNHNQKSIQYRNEVTHLTQKEHPSDSYFREQIEKQRAKYKEEEEQQQQQQKQKQRVEIESQPGWLAFEEEEEEEEEDEQQEREKDELTMSTKKKTRVYYYDFVTGTRQEDHPIAILRDQKPLQIADPSIFQNAATLHHQKTTTTTPYKK
jgi:hypothetical protein